MFTDFTFDNLGVPKHTEYPLNPVPDAPADLGLGPIVGEPGENGKFKMMTLRNVQLTGPFAHNGFFSAPLLHLMHSPRFVRHHPAHSRAKMKPDDTQFRIMEERT